MLVKKIFIFLLLSCCYLLLSACGTNQRGNPTPTPIPPLVSYDSAIFIVERGPIIEEKRLIGQVVPTKQDDIFFRTSGFITRVLFQEGEIFREGDLLAELQVDDLLNQLEQARIDLEVAQANLANYESQRAYDLEKSQSEVTIWEKRVDLAKLDLENSTGTNRDKAQINLEITEENLALARQSLALLNDDVNPYITQAVKRSELAVQRLESLIAERQITAPYDGILLRSWVRAGQQVDAYETTFRIGDPMDLIISAPYEYELATTLTENTKVYLYLNSEDEEGVQVNYLPGFQPERGQQSVNTTTATEYLYFSLPEEMPQDQVPMNRNFVMNVILGEKEDTLLLTPAAIREYRGLNFVIVLDGDRRRRVEINEIGLRSPNLWEIVADLEEGDQILGP
jgi:HlyD family secretion protein